MNTLHEFAARSAQCCKKTCIIFQLAISKLAIKTNKVDIRVIVSKLPVKVDIHINGA